jgi:hypothetical protein
VLGPNRPLQLDKILNNIPIDADQIFDRKSSKLDLKSDTIQIKAGLKLDLILNQLEIPVIILSQQEILVTIPSQLETLVTILSQLETLVTTPSQLEASTMIPDQVNPILVMIHIQLGRTSSQKGKTSVLISNNQNPRKFDEACQTINICQKTQLSYLNWFQTLISRENEKSRERGRGSRRSWKESSLRCSRSTLRTKSEGKLSCRMFICTATRICN